VKTIYIVQEPNGLAGKLTGPEHEIDLLRVSLSADYKVVSKAVYKKRVREIEKGGLTA